MIKTDSSEEFLKSVQRGEGVQDSLKSVHEVVRQAVEQVKLAERNNCLPKERSSLISSKSDCDESLGNLSFYSARTSKSESYTTARNSFCNSFHVVDQECPSLTQSQHCSTVPQVSFNESPDIKSCNTELTCYETNGHISKDSQSTLSIEGMIDKTDDCQVEVSVSVDSVVYNLIFSQEAQNTSDTKNSYAALDLLLLVYKSRDELFAVLEKNTGVIGYTSQYWTGYFPLLLIRKGEERNCPISKKDLELLHNQYSDTHHILDDHPRILEWIVTCYLHRERCKKKENVVTDGKCSECGLENSFKKTMKGDEKKKQTFLDIVKKSMMK